MPSIDDNPTDRIASPGSDHALSPLERCVAPRELDAGGRRLDRRPVRLPRRVLLGGAQHHDAARSGARPRRGRRLGGDRLGGVHPRRCGGDRLRQRFRPGRAVAVRAGRDARARSVAGTRIARIAGRRCVAGRDPLRDGAALLGADRDRRVRRATALAARRRHAARGLGRSRAGVGRRAPSRLPRLRRRARRVGRGDVRSPGQREPGGHRGRLDRRARPGDRRHARSDDRPRPEPAPPDLGACALPHGISGVRRLGARDGARPGDAVRGARPGAASLSRHH